MSVDLEGAGVDSLAEQLHDVRVVRHLRDADRRRLGMHLTNAVHRHQNVSTSLAETTAGNSIGISNGVRIKHTTASPRLEQTVQFAQSKERLVGIQSHFECFKNCSRVKRLSVKKF